MAQVRLDLREADGSLPDVCMRCGDEATITKRRHMSWCPPWVGVLILVGLLPYVIVALIMTKRAHVTVPLCDKHSGHWLYRNLFIWVGLAIVGLIAALTIGLLIALPKEHQDAIGPFVCIGAGGLGFIWLIGVIIAQSTAIKPKEITEREITLEGVAAEFVDAMDELDHKRRKRSRDRRYDDEDEDDEEDDDRPARKRSKSDAIEEDRPRRTRREADDVEEDRPRKKKRPRDDDDD